MRSFAATLCAAMLAACGGGGDDTEQQRQEAVARANAKEAEARSLGVTSPCAEVSQCGHLAFHGTTAGSCAVNYKAYSLVSPTAAAASAAAAEQRQWAARAAALASTDVACPAVVPRPPALACVASTCQHQM